MKDPSLKEFSAQSKELKVPRKLLEVNIDGDAQQVRIRVKCDRGEVWGDPDTTERAEIKDWEGAPGGIWKPAGCRTCCSKTDAPAIVVLHEDPAEPGGSGKTSPPPHTEAKLRRVV
jgi:hypothetical protein